MRCRFDLVTLNWDITHIPDTHGPFILVDIILDFCSKPYPYFGVLILNLGLYSLYVSIVYEHNACEWFAYLDYSPASVCKVYANLQNIWTCILCVKISERNQKSTNRYWFNARNFALFFLNEIVNKHHFQDFLFLLKKKKIHSVLFAIKYYYQFEWKSCPLVKFNLN